MRLLRGLLGSVLWILTGLLGLVGVVLCATIVLLPLGLVVLRLTKQLFGYSMALFLPRAVRHPVQESSKAARSRAGGAQDAVDSAEVSKRAKRAGKQLRKGGEKAATKSRRRGTKAGRRLRKRGGSAFRR